MVVQKITDIVRTSDVLFYIDEFQANAVYNILGNRKDGKIKFRVENTATGEKNISVQLIDKIDYPALQLQMELKRAINKLIGEDQLPV